LKVTFGSSGIVKRPSSAVTTVLVSGVAVSLVCAITQTPASRPLALSTTPMMNPCGARRIGCCAAGSAVTAATRPAAAAEATPSETARRRMPLRRLCEDTLMKVLLV
jgi:hypothetical protein